MRVLDSRYHKVWKVEDQNGFKKVNLGDSKKNKEGKYDNFTWYGCTLVSEAKDTPVSEGDTITVLEGVMSQYKNKEGKYIPQLTIFKFEVTKKSDKAPEEPTEEYSSNFEQIEDEEFPEGIPF